MKIKSLEIAGFKSFCDRTRVLFNNSVTGVVGPNGCGKSNIVDAIRWALGEQSAKNLRGKGMGDVIFNGSERRGPQSIAEVTVTFDNTDGLSHPLYEDYPEVAISRRLHRDGNSEYLINKTPCRLKDVTELFMGTGGGARAYSIIEQGRIGLIVSSRSEDRRSMIEEAAGITRFKKARQNAQRKMELTRQNLLRITDVVAEMGRQRENLKRQARKAERYNLYAAEQRDQELYLGSHRYLELLAARRTAEICLANVKQNFDERRVQVETEEARLEELRLSETTARAALEAQKELAHKVNSQISVLESEIRHLEDGLSRVRAEEAALLEQKLESDGRRSSNTEERSVLTTRLATLEKDALGMSERREQAEARADDARIRLQELGRTFDQQRDEVSRSRAKMASAQSAISAFTSRIDELESRLAVTRSERISISEKVEGLISLVASFEEQLSATAEKLAALKQTARDHGERYELLREQVHQCDDERRRVHDALTSATSRLNSLQEVNDSMGRHDNAVRAAVDALRKEGGPAFDGLFVDYLQCPKEWELALAGVLSDQLGALVVSDHQHGFELLSWLKERDLGRVVALPRQGVASVRRSGTAAVSDERILGRLVDFVNADQVVAPMLERLLDGVFVVDNEADAMGVWARYEGAATVVTRDGQVVDFDGMMGGGRAGSAGAGLLQQKREIRELAVEVERLSAQRTDLDARFENLKDEMQRSGQVAEQARMDAQRTEFSVSEVQKDRDRAAADLEEAQKRDLNLDKELGLQQQQLNGLLEDRTLTQEEFSTSENRVSQLERSIEEQSAVISGYRDEVDRLGAMVTEAKVREAQFKQQYQSAVERSSQIVAQEEELEAQLLRIGRRQTALQEETGRTAGRIVAAREKLAGHLDEINAMGSAVEQAAGALDERTQVLHEAQQLFKERRGELEAIREEVSQLQMNEERAHSDISYLLANIREKHDVDITRMLGDYHMRSLPGRETVERIAELKGLIDRMGSINPQAIEEYQEIELRYDEKVAQKDDIEQALEDLETAIARMDKDSRRMFKETFDAVNTQFQRIFPRLFKGGHARLELTDPGDMLSTGVDIVASPPGKKLRAIELMSGGEKALTAVSLLFAIFLQRPSPFCLLDEVDAPLDDANVARFMEMVREMTDRSQFVIITHSKITMEGADSLYGVTMQEPGVSKMISVNLVPEEEAKVANG